MGFPCCSQPLVDSIYFPVWSMPGIRKLGGARRKSSLEYRIQSERYMSRIHHRDFVSISGDISQKLQEAISECGPISKPQPHGLPLPVVMCRTIAGQQLSVQAARTIWSRVLADSLDTVSGKTHLWLSIFSINAGLDWLRTPWDYPRNIICSVFLLVLCAVVILCYVQLLAFVM